jgi:DNA-binding NtrC family response regulator
MIAVIDDQELLRDSLAQTLKRAGYKVTTFSDGQVALGTMRSGSFDLVITDLKMPGLDGVEFLRRLRSSGLIDLPVIMMTAYGTVATAVEAMKLGAYDYIQKPFEADQIEVLVARALREKELQRENEALRQSVSDFYLGKELIGRVKVMDQLRAQITHLAKSDATVLVEGESGTGKELVSRAIHAGSPRARRPMLCLNCAALSESLLESELFGHEKGAFTGADKLRKGRFELADGGTLLLDEISEIPMTLQAKLLRVLQEKQFERVGSSTTRDVNVRVIATTNRDLRQWIAQGKFRGDLYYRLSVLPIHISPLRERREDIPMLVEYFLEKLARRDGRSQANLSRAAMRLLVSYHWPGNVRELENLIERAWVLSGDGGISEELIEPWLSGAEPAENVIGMSRPGHLMEDMERELIFKTLARFGGHRARTAKALGIGLRTLGLKLKRWQEEGFALEPVVQESEFAGALGSATFAPEAQFVR